MPWSLAVTHFRIYRSHGKKVVVQNPFQDCMNFKVRTKERWLVVALPPTKRKIFPMAIHLTTPIRTVIDSLIYFVDNKAHNLDNMPILSY